MINGEVDQKVTVIMTSYNKPQTVGKVIESILEQTYTNWELFIMDDASNEPTQQVIKRYLNDTRINYYNSYIKDDKRFETARYATLINKAISISDGEYITYITDDNFFLPKRLETMVDYLNKNSNVGVVYSEQKIYFVDEHFNIIREKLRETEGVLLDPPNKVDHCSVMHRRKILNQIYAKYGNYWDDQPLYWHNADAAFWIRLAEFSAFYPIQKVLDINIKGPNSFQNLNKFLPEKIPNGTLVKGLREDVYLIEGGKRRLIDSNVFERLNFKTENIISIPDPVLFKYEQGEVINEEVFWKPMSFPNLQLIQACEGSPIYYIQNQTRRLVEEEAIKKYKFNRSNIISVSQDFIEGFTEGKPITKNISKNLPDGKLFKYKKDFYLSEDLELHKINKKCLEKLNIEIDLAIKLSDHEFTELHCGKPFIWLVKRWNKK